MNLTAILALQIAGFAVSFVVLDVSRLAGHRHWPSSHDVVMRNFRPFAIFLALFAGPSLLAHVLWRSLCSGGLRLVDGVLGTVVACGWACCYGAVIARLAGLPVA